MRLGTRGSALALAQAHLVAEAVGPDAEIVVIETRGDRDRAAVDKSKWVAELERALLDGEIDVAVHSAKDVPMALAEGTELAGVLPRADSRDVYLGSGSLLELPAGSRVGTASLRRAANIRCLVEGVEIVPIRGNVDTRLAKLAAGEVDGIVLAAAGLDRLERGETRTPVPFISAAGQGIVALQTRSADAPELPRDAAAWTELHAERACVTRLGADCHSALGVQAAVTGETLGVSAWAGMPDGSSYVYDSTVGAASDPEAVGIGLAERLLAAGAAEILEASRA